MFWCKFPDTPKKITPAKQVTITTAQTQAAGFVTRARGVMSDVRREVSKRASGARVVMAVSQRFNTFTVYCERSHWLQLATRICCATPHANRHGLTESAPVKGSEWGIVNTGANARNCKST